MATAVALLHKKVPDQVIPKSTPEAFRGVCYESITVGGRASCRFLYDDELGAEFSSATFGITRARVAWNKDRYWFWLRDHDPRRYYFCPAAEIPSTNLIPPLRPSFARWLINMESEGTTSFRDGEYEVQITTVDGAVTRQIYTREGSVEADLKVTAFQTKGTKKLPSIASLDLPGESLSLEIELGEAEVNPDKTPETREPEGLKGRSLAP